MTLTETSVNSPLKRDLDSARTFTDAELVISRAISSSGRKELLELLQELYREFIGPDNSGGGCSGTLQHIRTLTTAVSLTDSEVSSWGVNPRDFWAVLHHA